MSDENVTAVRRIYQAFNAGDADAALAHIDPQIDWIEPAAIPWGGTRRGHAGVREVLQAIGESTVDPGFGDDTQFLGDREHVVVVGTFSGTVRSTGAPLSWRFVDLWTLRDRLAVRFEAFFDTRVPAVAYGLS